VSDRWMGENKRTDRNYNIRYPENRSIDAVRKLDLVRKARHSKKEPLEFMKQAYDPSGKEPMRPQIKQENIKEQRSEQE